MEMGMIGGIWILVFLQAFLLARATRDKRRQFEALPNIIYPYGEDGKLPVGREAHPGDTCNFYHLDVHKILNTQVEGTQFDMNCKNSVCQYVFDKKGQPIPLTTEKVQVKNYLYDPPKQAADVSTVVYYKKCMCKPGEYFSTANALPTCEAAKQPVDGGFYCAGIDGNNQIGTASLLLPLILTLLRIIRRH